MAALEADQAAVTDELQAADQECKASLTEVEAARAAKKAVLSSIEKDQKPLGSARRPAAGRLRPRRRPC